VVAIVGAEVVAAREGFSADEIVGATCGRTSGSSALAACPRPSCGDVGDGPPATAFALMPSLHAAVLPSETKVVDDAAVVDGEPPGVCRPAGPPMWRLFIPAGVEPEFRL
jgi:hypothetical protein